MDGFRHHAIDSSHGRAQGASGGRAVITGGAGGVGGPQGFEEAGGVDWGKVMEQLADSDSWRELDRKLRAMAGGGALVVPMLRRTLHAVAQRAQQQAQDQAGGAGQGSGDQHGVQGAESTLRLVAAVQEVAWEKLHSGCWHEVAVEWRDAYALSCMLAAAAALLHPSAPPGIESGGGRREAGGMGPPLQVRPCGSLLDEAREGQGGGVSDTGRREGEEAALREALRQLDMGAIMGGPLFRPQLDALIAQLQSSWQRLGEARRSAAAPRWSSPPVEGHAGEGAPPGGQPRDEPPGGTEGEGFPPGRVESEEVPLPPGSMGPRGTPVPQEALPSLEFFWREYMGRQGGGIPVVVEGAMEMWPALERWRDVAYLRRVAGPRTVPVEVGEHYLADQWGQQLMTLQEFIDKHILGGEEGAPADGAAGAAARRGYLAQHPLFEQIPQLAADIREPDYCCLGEGELQSVNAWFGPRGTVTPLHTDPHHNLLCQAVGRKYVRLYRSEDTPAMYPFSEGLTTNSSQVDLDHPDPTRFPLLPRTPFSDCILTPGCMLYIPPGWWHYVKALDTSFSVSFWWK